MTVSFEPLPSLISIAEHALTIDQLAARDVQCVEASWTAAEALHFLSTNGFDAAPISAPRPNRFVDRDDLVGQMGNVTEFARPLDAPVLVTSGLSLSEGVAMLHDSPYYFVLEGSQLVGVVTRADLQRQPVSMVLLGFILAAEVGMNRLIADRLGDDWMDALSEKARADVESIYSDRVKSNVEISPIDCLMLHQRLALIGKVPGLVAELGYASRGDYRTWTKTMTMLRDALAHGGGLLQARKEPIPAIELFTQVRRFAELIWSLSR